jgi:hypothetical protein
LVCVPITLEGRILGALSALRPVSTPSVLRGDCQLLAIVGTLIAAHGVRHTERIGDADLGSTYTRSDCRRSALGDPGSAGGGEIVAST